MGELPVYKSEATPEQREEKLKLMGEQVRFIMEQDKIGTPIINVTIRCGCNKKVRLIMAYRCLYCGVFYCKECAEEHFGMRVE